MKRGKFISIEGPDGSGKGTQQQLLLERMTREGIAVATVDFPQYETSLFGEVVGKMLSGSYGPMNQIDPHIASVVYAADRFNASPYIISNLEKGIHVVANRYTLANMAHQSARLPKEEREEFIHWLTKMEYGKEGFNIPKPDIYIHLSVPTEISQELILQKAQRSYLNGQSKDELEADVVHQIEASHIYQHLAETLPGITTIECAPDGQLLSSEIIHESVWQTTSRLLREDHEGIIRGEREG